MRAARLLPAAVLALIVGASLGACGSNPSASRTPAGTTSTTTRGSGTRSRTGGTPSTGATGTTGSPTTSTTAPTSSPSTTAAPPTTTGTPGCQVADLHIVLAGIQGAAGTQELTFSLTNTSTAACAMVGYPDLVLATTAGAHLPTTLVHGGTLAFEDIASATVLLAPGQSAYVNAGFSDVQSGSTACTDAQHVEFSPPSASTSDLVAVPSGIHACDNGTVHVSAVFSSTNTAAMQTTAG